MTARRSRLEIVNLYAASRLIPHLRRACQPGGRDTTHTTRPRCGSAEPVVLAWGVHAKHLDRPCIRPSCSSKACTARSTPSAAVAKALAALGTCLRQQPRRTADSALGDRPQELAVRRNVGHPQVRDLEEGPRGGSRTDCGTSASTTLSKPMPVVLLRCEADVPRGRTMKRRVSARPGCSVTTACRSPTAI